MRLKFLAVPIVDGEEAATELNRFLAAHRVLSVDRHFLQDGSNSTWCFCISYVESGERPPPNKRGRIDYKEVLNESDFIIYAKLRDLRKQLSEQEGVPAYTLFTNEQLAAMVQQGVNSRAQLLEISGVGEGRAKKYGLAFIELMQQTRKELSATAEKKGDET